MTAPKKTRGY